MCASIRLQKNPFFESTFGSRPHPFNSTPVAQGYVKEWKTFINENMEKYIKEIVNHSDQRTDFTLLAYVIKSERNHNKEMVKLKLKKVINDYANEHTLKQCFRLAIAVLDLREGHFLTILCIPRTTSFWSPNIVLNDRLIICLIGVVIRLSKILIINGVLALDTCRSFQSIFGPFYFQKLSPN